MKKFIFSLMLVLIIALAPMTGVSETIDVLIKGVDDGVKASKQQDYKEAVMNAKLEAIERAGVEISSVTRVVNFQTKFDMVESKAQGILLPGFQIMDLGYQADGTYTVVLSGKIQVGEGKRKKGPFWGKLRSKPIKISWHNFKNIWRQYNPGTIENDFVDNGDGTITDWVTGLMWKKEDSLECFCYDKIHEKVHSKLNNSKFAGYSDWRVPTLEELASIVELKPVSKGTQYTEEPIFCIDPIFAPPASVFWSSDLSKEQMYRAGTKYWDVCKKDSHPHKAYFVIIYKELDIAHTHWGNIRIKAVRSVK